METGEDAESRLLVSGSCVRMPLSDYVCRYGRPISQPYFDLNLLCPVLRLDNVHIGWSAFYLHLYDIAACQQPDQVDVLTAGFLTLGDTDTAAQLIKC